MDLTRIQALIQRYGSRLDLPRSTLNTLSDIALSALGSTWLGGHITTANRISNKPEYRHPLIRDLVGAAPEIGIAELVELGLYLKQFANDPEIGLCLDSLRSPSQYESTLLQLAMAYRLAVAVQSSHLSHRH
jgi:hypothetical protein